MKMFQMKMAKPSATDIKAAEDLLHIFNLIDARFGGPWSTPGAGDSLHDLLEGGEEEFDCEDDTHLKTLYNNLASLLRTAPSFYARVISGMCHVVMNEQNQLLDPDSDCIDLHPRFAAVEERLAKAVAERDRLQRNLAFTEQWHAVRFERLADLGKSVGCWDAMAAIIANGTTDQYEPPTYAQQLARANHRAEVAERERDQLRTEAEVQQQKLAVEQGNGAHWKEQYQALRNDYQRTIDEKVELCAELVATRGKQAVATLLPGDPCDERPGFYLSLEDKQRLAALPAGTKLYALPPSSGDAITDTQRLDFILRKCRKVIVERLPNDRLEVYVEEGFMGETQHPVIAHRGDWAEASAEAAAVKRKAIDAAILWCETDGDAAKDGTA